MGIERAAAAGLTSAQVMDFWIWLWLGFAEREVALARRSPAPGAAGFGAELTAELVALESVSSHLSAELPVPPLDAPAGRTYSRLQGGLAAASVERLAAWLAEPVPQPAARIRRRATEVLTQAREAPPPPRPEPPPSSSGPGSPEPRPIGGSSSPAPRAIGARRGG